MKNFWVADLNAKGEVQLEEHYTHDQLLQLPLGTELVSEFAMYLWRDAQQFDINIPQTDLKMRWRASSETSGIATLRSGNDPASVSLLLSGVNAQSDQLTLEALQKQLLHELHDTGIEPAFDILHIPQRPLVASIHLRVPAAQTDRMVFALADRCFAAAYFRVLGIC